MSPQHLINFLPQIKLQTTTKQLKLLPKIIKYHPIYKWKSHFPNSCYGLFSVRVVILENSFIALKLCGIRKGKFGVNWAYKTGQMHFFFGGRWAQSLNTIKASD